MSLSIRAQRSWFHILVLKWDDDDDDADHVHDDDDDDDDDNDDDAACNVITRSCSRTTLRT